MKPNMTTNVISAPDGFSRAAPDSLGLPGEVTDCRNGIAVIMTRIGEVVIRVPQGIQLSARQTLTLKPGLGGDTALIILPTGARPVPLSSQPFLDTDLIAPVVRGRYSEDRPTADPVAAHKTAADASFGAAVTAHAKEDPFMVARALSLTPCVDGDTQAAISLVMLFVSLARGDAGSWLGAAKPAAESLWTTMTRKSSIEIAGMGRWSVRQFPVSDGVSNSWGLFATPEEAAGRVSRFIIEVPTAGYGLVQVKAFGTSAAFEIVINSTTEPSPASKSAIRAAVEAAVALSGAEVSVKVFSDSRIFANLMAARRITMEA